MSINDNQENTNSTEQNASTNSDQKIPSVIENKEKGNRQEAKTTSSNQHNSDNIKVDKSKINTAIVVEIVAILIALAAVITSIRGNYISNENLQLAKQALEEAKDESIKKDIETAKRFKIDSTKSESQIIALKEQIKLLDNQFKIENKPFLIVDSVSIKDFSHDGGSVQYYIKNIGKYPVKTVFEYHYIGVGKRSNPFKRLVDFKKTAIAETSEPLIYLYGDFRKIAKMDFKLLNDGFRNLIEGKDDLYYGGEVIFMDLITSKKMTYKFLVRMEITINKLMPQIIYSDNSYHIE
jgi:hypothetical protein